MKRFAVFLLPVFFAGCEEHKIEVYTIPKEKPPLVAGMPGAGSSAVLPFEWTVPAGWKEQPLSEMRQGSFLVTGANGEQADISVISFPGAAGGDLPNINRWRGQVELPALTEEDLQGLEKISTGVGEALLVEMEGKQKIIGAILKQPDRTWFFKMMGGTAIVTAEKGSFVSFVTSIRGGHVHTHDHTDEHEHDHSQSEFPAGDEHGKLSWKLPLGWEELPGSETRQGNFVVKAEGQQAEVTIIGLQGNAGGWLATVNLWRSQVGLEPVETVAGEAVSLVEGEGQFVELDGQRVKLLGVMVETENKSWFVKMTGPKEFVTRQKPVFLEFLKSVHLPHE